MPRTNLSAFKAATILVVAVLAGAAGPATSPLDVKEPDELHTGPPRGYTPATLKGASVIDLAGLEALIAQDQPVLLDVLVADRKPAGLPAKIRWMPTHRSIPGAVWLPGSGEAPLTGKQEDVFLQRMEALTGGDRAKPVVTFCRPDCWASWNAGKRLVQAGYARVYWFPSGVEGWQDAHETAVVEPDPVWASAVSDGQTSSGSETLR